MRKRVLTAFGIFVGVFALVTVACSQPDVTAPASTDSPGSDVTAPVSTSTGETTDLPVSSKPPVMVSILDTVNPNVCSCIHAINACFTDGQPPAGIPLGEYTGLFQMAREHLERFGIRWESVKILDLEKVDWGDGSLGNPEPGMMYAQVITPGFKMSLTADGGHIHFSHEHGTRGVRGTAVASGHQGSCHRYPMNRCPEQQKPSFWPHDRLYPRRGWNRG